MAGGRDVPVRVLLADEQHRSQVDVLAVQLVLGDHLVLVEAHVVPLVVPVHAPHRVPPQRRRHKARSLHAAGFPVQHPLGRVARAVQKRRLAGGRVLNQTDLPVGVVLHSSRSNAVSDCIL